MALLWENLLTTIVSWQVTKLIYLGDLPNSGVSVWATYCSYQSWPRTDILNTVALLETFDTFVGLLQLASFQARALK